MIQSKSTSNKPQTGDWNSGAVALPVPAMTNALTVFLYSSNGCTKKEDVKQTRSASGFCR
ncbi:hypothetical protein [Aeromonas hydrophila]|uniref:hypothetical protein n=1 Tax=Aeromonas hydrophila TaxID=644 RepID=UPI003216B5DF